MSIKDLQAIDVHGHYGTYYNRDIELWNEFYTGSVEVVLERARLANTRLTIVSPRSVWHPNRFTEANGNSHQARKCAPSTRHYMGSTVDGRPDSGNNPRRLKSGSRKPSSLQEPWSP